MQSPLKYILNRENVWHNVVVPTYMEAFQPTAKATVLGLLKWLKEFAWLTLCIS